MKRLKVGILAIALSAGLAACGEDSTGPSDALTEAEAQAVAQFLLQQTLEAGDPSSVSPGGAAQLPVALAPVQFTNEGSITLPCPVSGSLAVQRTLAGTLDAETGEVSFDFSLSQVHDQCAVQPQEVDDLLVLNGSPLVASTLEFDRDVEGTVTVAGGLNGAVAWEIGDRAGICEVAVTFAGSGSAQGSVSNSVSGRVCGVEFSEETFAGPATTL
jgi:hypothetical protein